MRIDIITIFPEYLAPLDLSLVGKARRTGLLDVRVHDLRRFTTDVHRTVDDTPYGGGPGMVMKPEPWGAALDEVLAEAEADGTVGTAGAAPTLVVPAPSGRPFTQRVAAELARLDHLVFAPARYEGIDQRVVDHAATRMPVRELSIGDYVLAGGEAAVLVMAEATARLLPGVLGNAESARDDSFAAGPMSDLLEGPVYTKPASWRGLDVPPTLLSGNHGEIARHRRAEALRRTAERRPDLVERLAPEDLGRDDREVLAGQGFAQCDGRFRRTVGGVEE